MSETIHYALIGLGYLGSVAVVVVTLTWGLRGKLDGLSTEIKLGQSETKRSVDRVMSENEKQTLLIGHLSENVGRLETVQREHERKDDGRFAVLGQIQTDQAVHAKAITMLESQRRPGYTPSPFPPPKGSHG